MRRLFLVTSNSTPTETPPVDENQPVVESPTPEIDPGDVLLSDLFGVPLQSEEEVLPETPSGTAPATDAPPAEAPAAEAPAGPSELDILRQRLHTSQQQNLQYEQQLQTQAEEQQRQSLDQETRQFTQELQAQGVTPDIAARLANQQRQIRENGLKATRQLEAQRTDMESKMIVALKFAEEYGVSAQDLMKFSSPTEMEQSAQIQKLTRDQKAGETAQKRAAVPAQSFDSASPAAPGEMDGAKLEQAVGEGTVDLTPDVIKKLEAYRKKQGFV